MQIFVKTLVFGTTTLDVEAADTIDNIKSKLRCKIDQLFTGYDIELALAAESAAKWIYAGKQLDDDGTVQNYNIQKESTIETVFDILGGVGKKGVIKKHLKPTEAVNALADRAKKYYQDNAFDDNSEHVGAAMPATLATFLSPIEEETARLMGDGEPNSIKRNLKAIPSEDLTLLLDIMSQKVGRHTEDRMLKMMKVMLPMVKDLEVAKYHLERAEQSVIMGFTEVFAKEYHRYSDGTATFDVEAFRSDVKSEIDKRAGATEALAVQPDDTRCSIQ